MSSGLTANQSGSWAPPDLQVFLEDGSVLTSILDIIRTVSRQTLAKFVEEELRDVADDTERVFTLTIEPVEPLIGEEKVRVGDVPGLTLPGQGFQGATFRKADRAGTRS
jgi:hypothetical protein